VVGRAVVDGIMRLTGLQLDKLLETCAVKYEKAMIEPGACHMHLTHVLVFFSLLLRELLCKISLSLVGLR
jgi:hypothetical protein